MVWDDSVEVFVGLRALLADSASLFPALLGPYLMVRGNDCAA